MWKFLEKRPFFRADTAGLGKYCTGGYVRIGVYRVKAFTCLSKVTSSNIKKALVKVTFPSPLPYLKPIFHCDTKPLALGWIPNVTILRSYTIMLVSKNAKTCVTPNANPKICIGSPTQNFRVGHVDFMLFIPLFSVEYGL